MGPIESTRMHQIAPFFPKKFRAEHAPGPLAWLCAFCACMKILYFMSHNCAPPPQHGILNPPLESPGWSLPSLGRALTSRRNDS